MGEGKAIGNVLHHEELGADFNGPYELDDRGQATKRFETLSDVFKWIRVR